MSFVTSHEPEDWADIYIAAVEIDDLIQTRKYMRPAELIDGMYAGNAALQNYHDLKQTQAELAYARSRPEAHLDTTFQEIDNAD